MIISLRLKENIPKDEVNVSLDGVVYNLRFIYSQYDESWFMSIDDIVNIKVVTGIDLLDLYRHLDVPSGEIKAIRRIGDKSKPAFADLGTDKDIDLVYITDA